MRSRSFIVTTRLALLALLALSIDTSSVLASRALSASPSAPAFDEREAMEWVRRQVALGPRVPGTEPHHQCLELIESGLRATGLDPFRQAFPAPAPGPTPGAAPTDTLTLHNVIAQVRPELRPRLLLGAHWDTRPWSDKETDPARVARPVPGANDGASGTAILLTLAGIFQEHPPPIGIDLVFFDGEDMGREGHPEEYALGSQWMAAQLPIARPDYVLVLDMVGSVHLRLHPERWSQELFPQWVDLIFQVGEQLGYPEFDRTNTWDVFDDHVPFLRLGIPSTVLIGFDDPNWHTLDDELDAIDPHSLETVGSVALALIYGGYLEL